MWEQQRRRHSILRRRGAYWNADSFRQPFPRAQHNFDHGASEDPDRNGEEERCRRFDHGVQSGRRRYPARSRNHLQQQLGPKSSGCDDDMYVRVLQGDGPQTHLSQDHERGRACVSQVGSREHVVSEAIPQYQQGSTPDASVYTDQTRLHAAASTTTVHHAVLAHRSRVAAANTLEHHRRLVTPSPCLRLLRLVPLDTLTVL
mmetsp:Transcript_22719/g.73070  ORF Transcript_22719/g.73070 Transcript_22719/m.73070 type:complete len:202 (+) Transcript_22719:255-860(+)